MWATTELSQRCLQAQKSRSRGQNQWYGHGQDLRWISIASVSGKPWLQTPPLLFGRLSALFLKEQLSICRSKVLGLPPSFFLSWMVRVVFPTEFWAKQTNLLLRSLWVTVVRTAVYSMTVLLKLDSGLGKEKKTWHPRSATSIANHPGELGRRTKLVGTYQKTRKSTRWGRRLSLLSKWQTLLRTYTKV